jgi:endonuclease III
MPDSDALVRRLAAALKLPNQWTLKEDQTGIYYYLTPEQVARALEAMREAKPCPGFHTEFYNQCQECGGNTMTRCDACWANMVAAFCAALEREPTR